VQSTGAVATRVEPALNGFPARFGSGRVPPKSPATGSARLREVNTNGRRVLAFLDRGRVKPEYSQRP
jgi:hypothetical protein